MNEMTLPTWLKGSESRSVEAPTWLSDFREQNRQTFLQNGLPNRKDERWKYADLSALIKTNFVAPTKTDDEQLEDAINQHRLRQGKSILLVMVNGYFMWRLSDMAKLPENVIVMSWADALREHPELIKQHWNTEKTTQYPFANLNAAASQDGLFFYVPEQCEIEEPIHFLSIVTDKNEFIAHPEHLFVLGRNAKVTFFEEHFSIVQHAYFNNIVTTIKLDAESQFEYYKIQNEGKLATHLAHYFVFQKKDSTASFTHFSIGGLLARDELIIKLQETGAACSTYGFYHLQYDNQYIDHHIDINHQASRSHSEMLYKGIVNNKARSVFNGRLRIEKDAQKIVASQANHNLLLSQDAESYSKPDLEIYADDVKCKHGATIGQLDRDALFYMRARGISEDDAIQILLQGFADEIIQKVKPAGIKLRIQEALL